MHVSEQTIFRTLDLSEGQDWVFFADLNVIGLSSRLDVLGRRRALDELIRTWRGEHLRLVDSA